MAVSSSGSKVVETNRSKSVIAARRRRLADGSPRLLGGLQRAVDLRPGLEHHDVANRYIDFQNGRELGAGLVLG